ncbi:MAG: MltA domain-containing protein [Asticcacaulis sp.]|nr:MltA domain-containing protein [Asticcacaulis sp.]
MISRQGSRPRPDWRHGAALALTLLMAACAEHPHGPVTPPVTLPGQPQTPPVSEQGPNPVPEALRLSHLPGWDESDAFVALEALRGTCAYKKGRGFAAVCQAMASEDFESPGQVKAFLLRHLQIAPVNTDAAGLLTGYFVPDYDAVTAPTEEFSQPVRMRPDDLVYVAGSQMTPPQTGAKVAARKIGSKYVPYYTRAEIEKMPALATYYMRPEDYFFMQLQGSGFLDLPDGKRIYAAYAADNGYPFVGIARVMVDRGILQANQTSGDTIHAWLAAHRGDEAQKVMNANPRYAFFVIVPDQTAPNGAAGLPLPPGSAIAVDPAFHDYGDLFWLDAHAGGNALADAFPAYQRLVAALDTGGAIKGDVRADLYVGHGSRAGTEAGRIKHVLKMYRILPFVADTAPATTPTP